MVSNKLNTGELVASEMESLMVSEEYRSLFKPSLTVTAAKKKDDEDKKKKCKCPPFCKCPGSKGEKCKCKKHKKEAAVEEVAEMLAKVSEQLDEANLSKTAAAALKLINSLVAEAMDEDDDAADDGEKEKDECEGDDNEARVDPGSSIDVGVSAFDDESSSDGDSELDRLIREQKEDDDSEETLEDIYPEGNAPSFDEDDESEASEDEEDDYGLDEEDGDEEGGEGVRALMRELDIGDSDDGLEASAAAKDKDKEKAKKEKEKAKAQALKEKEKAQAAKEKEKEKAAKEKEKEKAAKEKEKAKKDKK